MNKRIDIISDTAVNEFHDALKNEDIIPDEFFERFAELIVQECAQVCNDIDSEYEGEDVLATWCAKAIRDHFGIEE